MNFKPGKLDVSKLTNKCDVCGRRRGGTPSLDHSKCAKVRKARGAGGFKQ